MSRARSIRQHGGIPDHSTEYRKTRERPQPSPNQTVQISLNDVRFRLLELLTRPRNANGHAPRSVAKGTARSKAEYRRLLGENGNGSGEASLRVDKYFWRHVGSAGFEAAEEAIGLHPVNNGDQFPTTILKIAGSN